MSGVSDNLVKLLHQAQEKNKEYEKTLNWIENRCESLWNDSLEADKVNCHAQSIVFEIAKVYPKYKRSEERK